MYTKTVETLVTASVIFYLRILLSKSNHHKSNREPYFSDKTKALSRMSGDISTIRKYFIDLSESSLPSLKRIIDREFSLLDTIHEMLTIAAGCSESEARDFVLVIQKRIRNIQLTKFLLGDLWHLMNPADELNIYELIESMEEEMKVVAPTDEEAHISAADRSSVPGLRLDQMIAIHVNESKSLRRRPLKDSAITRADIMLQGWKSTFAANTAVVNRNLAVGVNAAAMNAVNAANAAVDKFERSVGSQLPNIGESTAATALGGGAARSAIRASGSGGITSVDSYNSNKKSSLDGDKNKNPFSDDDDDDGNPYYDQSKNNAFDAEGDINNNPFEEDKDNNTSNRGSTHNPFDDGNAEV